MGYMVHHSIIVTSWNKDLLRKIHSTANSIFMHHEGSLVSPIVKGIMNGFDSFFVAPDGSKDGWEDSDWGDSRRKEFIEILDKNRYEDGSSSLDWCVVQYGDDERDDKLLQSVHIKPA